MRKGFTLMEVLIAVIILPIMLIILNGLFKTLIKDIPRSQKVLQTNTSLLNMLKYMQQDINKAKALPEKYNEYSENDKMLLIELPEGMICYQLKDDKVIRRRLTDNQKDNSTETKYWSAPHAKVEWNVWRKDKTGYAVEVRTHIEYKVYGHWERKMANSHLYFVGIP
jgi:prepilin-type N-terminal cleavage/methylation domain-containing protein